MGQHLVYNRPLPSVCMYMSITRIRVCVHVSTVYTSCYIVTCKQFVSSVWGEGEERMLN